MVKNSRFYYAAIVVAGAVVVECPLEIYLVGWARSLWVTHDKWVAGSAYDSTEWGRTRHEFEILSAILNSAP